MVTQNQVECDFIFIEIPKLRKVHGENTSVFIEEWENYLKELARDGKVPKHAHKEWKFPYKNWK